MLYVAGALSVALLLGPAPLHSPAQTERVTGAAPPKLFVAWSPEGLPSNAKRALERVRGVRGATPVLVGLDWIMGSRANGETVDDPPNGAGYPIEIGVVAPGPYSKFVDEQYRDAVRRLDGRKLLLPGSERRLRGAGDGLLLRLKSGNSRVMEVVPDVVTQGFEGLMSRPAPRRVASFGALLPDPRGSERETPCDASGDRERHASRRAAGHQEPERESLPPLCALDPVTDEVQAELR